MRVDKHDEMTQIVCLMPMMKAHQESDEEIKRAIGEAFWSCLMRLIDRGQIYQAVEAVKMTWSWGYTRTIDARKPLAALRSYLDAQPPRWQRR